MSDYQARPEISKHKLDQIARCPAFYAASVPIAQTPAMRWGTLVHAALLEPEKLKVTVEDIDRRTKGGKERWVELQTAGVEVISSDEAQALNAMRASFESHPAMRKLELLHPESVEHSFFAELEGVACKCRPDAVTAGGFIVDLKTTQNASQKAFTADAFRFRYHVQGAFYKDLLGKLGIDIAGFIFVAVEKDAPYLVQVFDADWDFIAEGRKQYKHDLATFRHCRETATWPGYNDGVTTLSLPAWVKGGENE